MKILRSGRAQRLKINQCHDTNINKGIRHHKQKNGSAYIRMSEDVSKFIFVFGPSIVRRRQDGPRLAVCRHDRQHVKWVIGVRVYAVLNGVVRLSIGRVFPLCSEKKQ